MKIIVVSKVVLKKKMINDIYHVLKFRFLKMCIHKKNIRL